uniref:hypothetical protein n=1 Tax=Pigmentiphaga litoralis TaxID=516702 RepID=UPI00389B04B8
MGYTYRGRANLGRFAERLMKLELYSEGVKRAQRKPLAGGRTGAAKTRAALRAAGRAEAKALSRGPLEPADWEQYADNPECWGGAFGLWMATQEAKAWRP